MSSLVSAAVFKFISNKLISGMYILHSSILKFW